MKTHLHVLGIILVVSTGFIACYHPDEVEPDFCPACDCLSIAGSPGQYTAPQAGGGNSTAPSPNTGGYNNYSAGSGPAGNPSVPTGGQTPLGGSSDNGGGTVNPSGGQGGDDIIPNNTKCDMTGRWLIVERGVFDALGQFQLAIRWMYYEFKQTGDRFEATKGVLCGDDGIGLGFFAVTADFSRSRDACMEKTIMLGRKGTSELTADGKCHVHIDRFLTARSVTLPYYLDESIPLPSIDQKAADGVPGWEDWDQDGQPGITGVISGVVQGELYISPRRWTESDGIVPDVSSLMTLALRLGQDKNLLGASSDLLKTPEIVATDPSVHFTQLIRLSDNDARGQGRELCDQIHQLAEVLMPDAVAAVL